MARKKKRTVKKFEFKGFVNLEFNTGDRKLISDWMDTFEPDVSDSLMVLAEGGYKVGVSYNDYHGAFHIAATCKVLGEDYCGYCFTLVHADPGRGVNIMRYFYDSHLQSGNYRIEQSGEVHDW